MTPQDLSKIEYSREDGSTIEKAIIILNAKNSYEGIPAEYAYINKKYGKRDVEWIFVGQALLNENNKNYDLLTIKVPPSDDEIDIYFDITDFFGKY